MNAVDVHAMNASVDTASEGERARPATGAGGAAAERDNEITMDLLHAVHADAQSSQRSLSRQLDIALGLTNAYLKRCVGKGWIKVTQTPANRYAYYLTPQGFAEKSRRTANYLYNSFRFYRRARNQCDELLAEAADAGRRRVALAGAGELAEIAMLCALQHDIQVVGVLDPAATANRFRHVALVRDVESLPAFDLVLVTDLKRPQRTFDALVAALGADRVAAPRLLKVARTPAPEATGEGAT
jgi:DNA-binding MarR family transcriptional regulator